MSNHTPWEVCPQLTADKLQVIAQIVKDVRRVLVDLHEPEEGDNNWSLGCRVYARICHSIERAAESGTYPWLDFQKSGLEFVITIDGVPVKFFHGEPDGPPARTCKINVLERAAGQMAFANQSFGDGSSWIWRMAVEVDEELKVLRVVMVQVSAAEGVRNFWPIPLGDSPTALGNVMRVQREGVDLGAPPVGELETAPARAVNVDGDV